MINLSGWEMQIKAKWNIIIFICKIRKLKIFENINTEILVGQKIALTLGRQPGNICYI